MKLNKEDMELVMKYSAMTDSERNFKRICLRNNMSEDDNREMALLQLADEVANFMHRIEFSKEIEATFD